MNAIDDLMKGSVDIHVHFSPDPRVERRSSAIEIVEQASFMGMGGLVLKSHEYPTQPLAYTVGQLFPDIAVIGGICADYEIGGLNPSAVEASAKMGSSIVWMPTYSAKSDRAYRGLSGGITILDDNNKLLPEVYEILDIVKQYDMVLATGHISTQECFALIEAGVDAKVERLVWTHGTTSAHWTGITVDEMKAIADKGAFVEHCIHVMMPTTYRLDPKELISAMDIIGMDRSIISTDFGQNYHPMPAEGFRMGMGMLRESGMTEDDIYKVVNANPRALLGI